jgi:hypothetical protein
MAAAAGELIADCGLKRTAAKPSAQIRGSNHRFGCISEIRAVCGLTIWIADAHRDDGKHYVLCAKEKLMAFIEMELAIRICSEFH